MLRSPQMEQGSTTVDATANDWVPHRQTCAAQTPRLLRMINRGTLDLVDLLNRSFNLHRGLQPTSDSG